MHARSHFVQDASIFFFGMPGKRGRTQKRGRKPNKGLSAAQCTTVQRLLGKTFNVKQALHSFGKTSRSDEKLIYDEMHAVGSTPTPFGKLEQTLSITLDGIERTYRYIQPFGILQVAADTSNEAARFYFAHLHGRACHIVMHLDEFQIGNVLRPDSGRKALQVTWQFAELPEYFRSRSVGWFPFTCIPSKEVSAHNTSVLFAEIVKCFFLEDNFNFLEGVLFSYNGVESYMTAELAAVIADAKQHAEVACLKGASGTKCCPCCVNVVMHGACKEKRWVSCRHRLF